MDELAILRAQVSTERRHMKAVKNAVRAALDADADAGPASSGGAASGGADARAPFLDAARGYLLWIVDRFNAQDEAHCALLRARIGANDGASHALIDDLEARLRASRNALAALSQADDVAAGLRRYTEFFDAQLAPKRHVLGALFDEHYRVEEWRAAALVDADTIVEERRRYAAVTKALPPGLRLDDDPHP